jgi:hypothetical protein
MSASEKVEATVQVALANLNALIEPLLETGPLGERHDAYRLLVEDELRVVEVGMLPKRPKDRINRIYCGLMDNRDESIGVVISPIGVVISPITETGGISFACSKCGSEEPCQHVLGAVIAWFQKNRH